MINQVRKILFQKLFYLNSLYKFLILSLNLIILYHYDKTKNNSKLLEDPENINLTKEFNDHIKENNNEENQSFNPLILNIVLSYSNFFDHIYIMKNFLVILDEAFNKRFC